jgi:hypothetical protein
MRPGPQPWARARGLLALVLVALTGTVAARAQTPTDDPTVRCRAAGQLAKSGDWTLVQAPRFPDAGPSQAPAAHAVDPRNANVLYLSNGTTIARSDDGGCSWTFPFQVPTTPTAAGLVDQTVNTLLPRDTPRAFAVTITHLAAGDNGIVYAAMVARTAATTAPLAAVSTDAGRSFQQASVGMPAEGHPVDLEVSPADPRVAWVLFSSGQLVATENAGGAWQPRQNASVNGGLTPGTTAGDLWVYGTANINVRGSTGLLHSTDGGRSLAPVLGFQRGVGAVDIVDGRIVAFRLDGDVLRSGDGGASFSPAGRTLGIASSAGHGASPEHVVAITTTGVELHEGGTWFDASPAGADSLVDVRVTRTPDPRMVIRTGAGLVIGPFPAAPSVAPPELAPVVDPLKLRPPGPASFRPDGATVEVAPGTTSSLDLALDLPHRARAIDLFFLVDTTASMQYLIAALRRSLDTVVGALAVGGIDVQVGVGDFKDYPVQPFGSGEDYPYRLVRRIGPVDDDLRMRIANLQDKGGVDEIESQLAALFQATTGAGQALATPASPAHIPRGQEAGFRPGTLRAIVLATDQPFHRPEREPGYPGPGFGATVAALRANNVHVVGLRLGPGARADLEQVAVETGTVANVDLDCNGDRRRDVVAGQAVVCPMAQDGADFATAVVSGVTAIADPGDVTIVADGPGGVVREGAHVPFGPIGRQVDRLLPFRLTVGCTAQQAGQRFPVSLSGVTDGAVAVRGSLTVACRALPRVVPPPVRANPQPPAPPPNPPPPAPVPVVQPAPQVQANPQVMPQSTPQAQSGLAHQDQRRPQVAVAGAGHSVETEELAFTRPRPDPSPLPLYAGAVALALAAGLTFATRRRPELATIRTQKRVQFIPTSARSRRNPR